MGIVSGADLTFEAEINFSPVPATTTLALPTGGFIVVWVDDAYDIHVQKFSNDGVLLLSSEIVRDIGLYDGFFAPTLAVLSSGYIALTWTAESASATETDVLLQVFSSTLAPQLAVPMPVSTYGTGSQAFSQIAAIGTGGFAISWFGDIAGGTPGTFDVAVHAFTASSPVSDIRVNSATAGDQGFSIITGLDNGFVVSWFDVDDEDLYVGVFDDDGALLKEIAANALPIGFDGIIGTTALVSGGFVTAWSGETDGDADGIGVMVFDDAGTAVTPAVVEANTSTDGLQILSSVTALTGVNGGFVVAWGSCGCLDSDSAFAVFNDDGSARSGEIILDDDSDTIPTVRALGDGSFVAAWAYGDFLDGDLGFAIRVFNADGSLRYSRDMDLDDDVDMLPGAPLEIAALANGGFVLTAPLYTGSYSHIFDITREGPTSAGSAVTLLESTSHVFTMSNFPFSDAEQDSLAGVQITNLPANGALRLNGVAVSGGQTILPADITAGKLAWTPVTGTSGIGLASLGYRLIDSGGTTNGDSTASSAYSITFNVTRINDAPSAANVTRTTLEDVGYVFSTGSFGFADSDGDTLSTVTITALPAKGALTLAGQAVAAGQSVAATDIAAGKLIWTPPANANGASLASLSFSVRDIGGTANGGADTSGVYTLKFAVTAVNDAPLLDYQGPATTAENARLKLDVLADASDIDGGALRVTDAAIVSGFGKVTIGKDGSLRYDPTKGPNQDIAEGESRTVTVSYAVSDSQGGKSAAEIDITVEGISPDIFRGTPKPDKLTGTSGADRLYGLADNDRLDGRGGDDFMKGGKAADIFVFGRDYGRDTIVDFKPAKGDRIDLSDAEGITGFGDLMNHHAEEVGKKLIITADDGSVLVLKGVGLEDIDQSSFLF